MASYLSYTAIGDAWAAFCYREKERAYAADALPGRQPVSSPVATAADALSRPVDRREPQHVPRIGDRRGVMIDGRLPDVVDHPSASQPIPARSWVVK